MSALCSQRTISRVSYLCLVAALLLIGSSFMAACGTGPNGDTETAVTTGSPETDITTPEDSGTDQEEGDTETTTDEASDTDAEEPGMVEEAMTATTGIQRRTATATLRPTQPTATASATSAAVTDVATPDAATPDAATPDAATPDAATPDAATPDAATLEETPEAEQ